MGKREVTPLHRGGGELVMMAVKLLVKIAVMMAPGGTPVPPEARG